jgi:UDP-GlcNAc:undecaprenyl-phosphate/decaprenyl-phosphate GlcNAc-1-phosphate transferase
MNQLLWSSLQAFGFSLVLTPIFRDIFRSYKVVDEPDQNRKVHIQPIPRIGGIAIAIAYVLAFYLAEPYNGAGVVSRELSLVAKILPSAALIFLTGLLDDFIGLKPWQKLIGQIVASCLAWWAGVRMVEIAGHSLPEPWEFLLTIAWLLVCTNAFNLVDGLDGLAAGVGLFATLTIFASAAIAESQPLMFATLPLAGCLLGFLCFNFNPATVFLGDCGSLLIGFLLGCFGVIWTAKSVTLLGLTAPLMALSIPLLDVLLCIIRRWLRNQPIFSADRGHIHHKLLDRGLSPRQTVLMLYGLCGLGAAFSLLQSFLQDAYIAGGLVFLFAVVAWIGVHYLRYAEFMLAGQMIRTGEFQRGVNARLNLSSFEKAILNSPTMDDCWVEILKIRSTFGIAAVRLQAAGNLYEAWDSHVTAPRYWTMHVPLSERDYIELARELRSPDVPMAVVPFIELLAATLSDKLKGQTQLSESGPAKASAVLQTGN